MNVHAILLVILLASFFRLFLRNRFVAEYRKATVGDVVRHEKGNVLRAASYDDVFVDVASWKPPCESPRGFRCPDEEDCDCGTLCPNGPRFVRTTLPSAKKGKNATPSSEKNVGSYVAAGTYCVPPDAASAAAAAAAAGKKVLREEKKIPSSCLSKTSAWLRSAEGWFCRNGAHRIGDRSTFCKNHRALENEKNRLVDHFPDGRPGEDADPDEIDPYETYHDAERNEEVPRYRCLCESLDDRGNRMVAVTPFRCELDYCVESLKNVPALGWNGRRCECGPFPHANENRSDSPCATDAHRWDAERNVVRGIVPCTNARSFEIHPVLCPAANHDAKSFSKRTGTFSDPLDFVREHAKTFPKIIPKNER